MPLLPLTSCSTRFFAERIRSNHAEANATHGANKTVPDDSGPCRRRGEVLKLIHAQQQAEMASQHNILF